MNNLQLCQSAITLAQNSIEQDNLLLAFITGSRAKGNYNPKSDIDLFVILNQPSIESEKELAEKLQILHTENGLEYEHCGEIFSKETLDDLLKGIENLDTLVKNGFCHLACFQTDCILSTARKTLVVLNMLSFEKKMIIGNNSVLLNYERVAKEFYLKHDNLMTDFTPCELKWQTTDSNEYSLETKWQSYTNDLKNKNFLDTPVGIALERWFLPNPLASDELPTKIFNSSIQDFSPNYCPLLNASINQDMNRLLSSQCLGIFLEK